MGLEAATLDDKYDLGKNRILLTGTQAIVRLTLMQHARDRRMGKHTAGYVTGYRGSPLGGLDQQFWRAAKALQGERRALSAGGQRGSRGDGAVGIAAGGDARRGALRRRLRPLVRQGTRRRSFRRRAEARQSRRHVAVGRRARADGRRPHLRIIDHGAPIGIRLRRRHDPDPVAGGRPGDHRLRPVRALPCRASPGSGSG